MLFVLDTNSKPELPVVSQVVCVVIAALIRVYITHLSHFFKVYGAHFFPSNDYFPYIFESWFMTRGE